MLHMLGSFYFTTSQLMNSKKEKRADSFLICINLFWPHYQEAVTLISFCFQGSHAPSAQMHQCDNVTGDVFDGMILSIRGSAICSLTMVVYGGPAHLGALESK